MGVRDTIQCWCLIEILAFTFGMTGRAGATTVAYYRFEDGVPGSVATTVTDSSGNGLNGTAMDSPVYSSKVPSTPFPDKVSMSFNGNGWVFVPDSTKLALTKSLTVEAYVNPSAINTGNGQYILFRGDNNPGLDPYTLQAQYVNGKQAFVFAITDASGNTAYVSTPVPALNQWYEVAGTLDNSSGKMDLYLNDVLMSTTTTSTRPYGTLDSTQDPGFSIGNLEDENQGNVSKFNGLIDEVRVSDQALPASQLLAVVPEPSAISLLAAGLCGVKMRYRRR